jgi:hypothetical protein
MRSLMRGFSVVGAAIAVLALSSSVRYLTVARADAPESVYRLDIPNFRTGDYGNWSATIVPRSGGSGGSGLKIVGVRDGWHNCLFRPAGLLKGGRDYTAEITYEIVEPTRAPGTFYMYARSKRLGQTADVWRDWTGSTGAKGTVRLPMTLRDTDDWTFTVGMLGPGTIIIDDFRIVERAGRVVIPAVPSAAPPKTPAKPAKGEPTGAASFTVEPPAPGKGITLSAADFGLTSDTATPPANPIEIGQKNTAALTAALAACQTQKASRLTVKPGVYRFASDDALQISGFKDFTFDGGGAEFIVEKLHPGKPVFRVENNERCVIKNLTVDWDWNIAPLATLSQVTALSADGKTIDLTFPEADATPMEHLKTLNWLEFWPINPKTFQPILGPKIWIPRQKRLEVTGPKSLRVTLDQALPLVVGTSYNIRHFSYEMNAFNMKDNRHLLFDKVTLYSVPGMGWLNGGNQQYWGFRNCRIVLRPGTRRPMAVAADGFHSYESQGYLFLENCEISHCGDDCVNIHDNCGSNVQRRDDHTLFAPNIENWRARFAVGDEVELCNPDYSPTGFVSKLTAYKREGNTAILTFADTLPAAILANSIIWNHRYNTANVRITDCNFHDSGGRGILLSAQNARVEGCTFSHLFGGAFQFQTEIMPGWTEGHGASNVVFQNNVVDTVSLREVFAGASVYATAVLPSGPTSYPLFHDILIANNQFTDCDGAAIQLSSCRNVIVRGNTIRTNTALANVSPLRSLIVAERASDMALGGNRWYASPFIKQPGVSIDSATTKGIDAAGNLLLAEPTPKK